MPTATTHPRTAPVDKQPPFEAAFSCVEQQGMDQTDERSAEQAGFDDDNDVPTETPGTEAAPEQQEPEQPAPVEYAQLTQADVEELRGWKPAQEKLAGMAFGKIGGLERRFADQDQAIAKANEIRARLTPEKIAALRDDFPDFADAMEIVRSLPGLPVSVGVAPEKVEEMVQQRVSAALESVPEVVDRNVQKILLTRQHKDWTAVTQSPEFAVFTKSLPPAEQQELATTWDSDFIGNVLTKFKASKAPPPTQRRSRAEAAVIPRGSGVTHNAVMSDEKSGFDAA